jgi:hypothetical protein
MGRWATAARYTRRTERYYLVLIPHVLHVAMLQIRLITLSLSAREEEMG